MYLHTVCFSSGVYEDYKTQTIAIFLTESEAEAHVKELEKAYADWNEVLDDGGRKYYRSSYYDNKPYTLCIDYNGPTFYTEAILVGSSAFEASIRLSHPELFI